MTDLDVYQWWAKLSPGQVDIKFVNAVKQLEIDWTKFNLGQVDTNFGTVAWPLKIDMGKLTSKGNRLAYFLTTYQIFWIKNLIILLD